MASPLAGRVALDHEDALLGRSFYIGSWHREWDGIQVVNWAAPIASLFFEGRSSSDELSSAVVGRRTFEATDDDLVDYVDEPYGENRLDDLFAVDDVTLDVPAPPQPVPRPVREADAPRPQDRPAEGSNAGRGLARSTAQPLRPPARPPRPPTGTADRDDPAADRSAPMRAERLVHAALERPRSGRLRGVISTLQPDQYRLVTWPPNRPLVVQGQPGTGKTIVATHRAAWLTHPEEPHALARVLLIGPTEQYVEHVRGVQGELGGGNVRIVSLAAFVRELAGPNASSKRTQPGGNRWLDTDWRVGRLLRRCAAALRRGGQLPNDPQRAQRVLVEQVIEAGPTFRQLVGNDEDLEEWRLELRSWGWVREQERFQPLLAAARLAVAAPAPSAMVDHLIVDEAQDVRPLEWELLLVHLKTDGGVTLLGDINQRHFDWTASTWPQLVENLELDSERSPVEIASIDVGFRSTRQILRFANLLLPTGQRQVHALRDGPEPRVLKCRRAEIRTTVIDQAEALARAHPDGLVAVIAMDPQRVSDAMRQRGWSRHLLKHGWRRDGRSVIVLRPEDARGLEFDGVVVVEPLDFPENVGRLGPLYTSLTRATKELVIVESRGLPRALRRGRR